MTYDPKVIRHWLIDNDCTPKELAHRVGISYNCLSYVLRGKYKWPAARRVMEYIKMGKR